MDRSRILDLIRIAAREGEEAALKALADASDAEREGRLDSLMAEREDAHGDYAEGYIPGCGEFDTVDYRGRPYLPAVNDAGEPYWM